MKNRQGLEEMVKQLQSELKERDNVISQLHEQMSVASFQTSPIHSPYVMSPGTTSPCEHSPDRTPPLGCSVDSAASSFFASHYKPSGFTDKDNKIIDLTEKNIDLERKLLDMDENLRAKDELIRVRTAAVTLMSADLSAKGKSTLDQLEDTRTEMRQMQSNFAENEAVWREKNSCLEVELANEKQRIGATENSLNRLEKLKFELTTKNAELQEKIVSLQTNLADIKAQKEEESLANYQFEEKMKEKLVALERTVEIGEKTRSDRKTEFIESIKNLVEDESLSEKMLTLENQLTELEEEKGNLQLKLVDFEDLASSEKMTKSELKETSEKLKQAEIKCSELEHEMQSLRKDNEDYVQSVQERDVQLEDLSSKLDQVLSVNADLSLSKVKLEMKSVELEESRDRLEEERKELISNIGELRKHSEQTCKTLMEVQKAHANLNVKMEGLQEEQKKRQNSQRVHDEDMLEKAEMIKEQKIALSQLEKSLHDKTIEMSDLLVQAEQQKNDLAKSTEEIQTLNDTITHRDEKILELSSLLDESTVQAHVNELKTKIENLETKLAEFKVENCNLNEKLECVQDQAKTLQEDLKEKIQTHQDFQDKIQDLTDKNAVYFDEIQLLGQMHDDLHDEVALHEKKIEAMEAEMTSKCEELQELEEAAENDYIKKQQYQNLEIQFNSVLEREEINNREALEKSNALTDEIKTLNQNHEELKVQSEEWKAERDEYQEQVEKLNEEMRESQEKVETSERKVEEVERKVEEAEQKVEKVEEEKTKISEKMVALRNKAKVRKLFLITICRI